MQRAQPDGCCWSRLWQKFQEIVRQRKWNLSLARLEGWVRCWNARLTDASATKAGGLLSVFLTWLLVARRLAVVFGRWSLKTRKTMMSHWHKLEVTGKRMKFSVSDLAIFSVILCRISVWAHLSVLCNLFFFLWTYGRLKKRGCLLWWDQPGKWGSLCTWKAGLGYHIQRMFHVLENIMRSLKQSFPPPLLPTVAGFAGACDSGARVLQAK